MTDHKIVNGKEEGMDRIEEIRKIFIECGDVSPEHIKTLLAEIARLTRERHEAMVFVQSLITLLLGNEYVRDNPKEYWITKVQELYRYFGPNVIAEINRLTQENAELRENLERERIRLAACGTAASANTEETIKQRIDKDHYYYSASYGDVCDAVDREMELREYKEEVESQFRKVMDEKCPSDEKHCTCVPFLRIEVEKLMKRPTFAEGFTKGREAVLRRNPSGCCCLFNEDEEIVSVCMAHKEREEKLRKELDEAAELNR